MDKIKGQLAGVAALLGVIAAIGGGFVKYGEIVTKLDALESQEHSTVDTSNIESEIAVQANEIHHIQDDMDEMKADIEEIKTSLAEIHKVLSEARGGWKTLMWAAGAGLLNMLTLLAVDTAACVSLGGLHSANIL